VSKAQRGEVWLVDLGMAAKVRPCLVVSVPYNDVERALVTLVPHTTRPRAGSRFEVSTNAGFLKAGVFDGQGLITVLIRRLGALRSEQLAQVEDAVSRWLGLNASGLTHR